MIFFILIKGEENIGYRFYGKQEKYYVFLQENVVVEVEVLLEVKVANYL